jgi:hypothetical protein
VDLPEPEIPSKNKFIGTFLSKSTNIVTYKMFCYTEQKCCKNIQKSVIIKTRKDEGSGSYD